MRTLRVLLLVIPVFIFWGNANLFSEEAGAPIHKIALSGGGSFFLNGIIEKSFGLNYEFVPAKGAAIGYGMISDYSFSSLEYFFAAPAVYFSLAKKDRVYIAPGLSSRNFYTNVSYPVILGSPGITTVDEAVDPKPGTIKEYKYDFCLRIGAFSEIDFGKFFISPGINFSISKEDIGLNFSILAGFNL